MPHRVHPFVLELTLDPPLPFPYEDPVMWVKAGMVQTVAFHRLSYLQLQQRDAEGKRQYDFRVLGPDDVERIRACVRVALGV
jgi:uncharacterized protein YifN (PemK superfamily)